MPAEKAAKLTAALGGVRQQQFLNIQYKLSGPADPNATYQFQYELKGGKGKQNSGLATGRQYPAGRFPATSSKWKVT